MVQFLLVIPFFILMVVASWDLCGLSLARLALQKKCSEEVQAAALRKNHGPLVSGDFLSVFPLSSGVSRFPFRSPRHFSLIRLEKVRNHKLLFPGSRFIFGKESVPLKCSSVALQVLYE